MIGGTSIKQTESEIKKFPDIIVATPGRLVDLLKNSMGFNLDNIEILVLDEADRLLDLGFKKEILYIINEINKRRQTLLFSATLTATIKELANLSLKNPIKIDASKGLFANKLHQ